MLSHTLLVTKYQIYNRIFNYTSIYYLSFKYRNPSSSQLFILIVLIYC